MALSYRAEGAAERRQGMRIRQERPVKVFCAAAGRYVPAQTVDLSPSGLRLVLPASAPVAVGALLEVHVAATARGLGVVSKRSMVPARVMWMERSGGQGVQVGLQYNMVQSSAAPSAA